MKQLNLTIDPTRKHHLVGRIPSLVGLAVSFACLMVVAAPAMGESLTKVGGYNPGVHDDGDYGGYVAYDVIVRNGLAYCSMNESSNNPTTYGLAILDVSDIDNIQLLGSWSVMTYGWSNGDIYLDGNEVFMAGSNFAAPVVNVSTPTNPIYKGNIPTSGGSIYGVVVANNIAYEAFYPGKILSYDVSDRDSDDIYYSAQPLGYLEIGTNFEGGIAVAGDNLYVANSPKITVVDVSNPSNMVLAGETMCQGGTVNDLLPYNGKLYAATSAGLEIYAIAGDGSLTLDGTYAAMAEAKGVALSGTTAYVAEAHALIALDVSNPASPQLIDSLENLEAWQTKICAAGGFVYAVCDDIYDSMALNIYQLQPTHFLTITPESTNVPAAASSDRQIAVMANVPWWMAWANVSWLEVTGGSTGSNNGTVTYRVANNTGAARTGTIVVAETEIRSTCTVVQAAAGPSLEINPTSMNVPPEASSGRQIAVTANVSWTATTNAPWLAVTGGSPGSGNGTVIYSVANNTGAARTGAIGVACSEFSRTCTVVQAESTSSSDFTYTTNGDNTLTITGYTGPGGTVNIPSSINGKTVTSIGEQAFFPCRSGLTSIAIPNTVTRIREQAFFACTGLTSVAIGNGVTIIDAYAFDMCSSLLSVTIPDSVTSIKHGVFLHCSSLNSIAVSTSNSAYSSTNGVLFNKSQTMLVEYPGGKKGSYTVPDSVIEIEADAFWDCIGLTSVTIPVSVTSIGSHAFTSCSGLTSITIPANVTKIGYSVFQMCDNLTSATIPYSVTSIEDMAFYGCPSLTRVYFCGNAPDVGSDVFLESPNSTVYRLQGASDWPPVPNLWAGRPTALWRPALQYDESFGVQTNRFGFNIHWASGQVVVVDACTNLKNNIWVPLQTNTLTGASLYFSDPRWTNYIGRFYRLRSP